MTQAPASTSTHNCTSGPHGCIICHPCHTACGCWPSYQPNHMVHNCVLGPHGVCQFCCPCNPPMCGCPILAQPLQFGVHLGAFLPDDEQALDRLAQDVLDQMRPNMLLAIRDALKKQRDQDVSPLSNPGWSRQNDGRPR